MDDNFIWTASGSSSVHRWRVPPGRAQRLSDQSPESPTSDPGSTFSLTGPDPLGMVPLTPASATFQDFSPSARRRIKGQSITPSFISSVSSLTPDIEIDGDGTAEIRDGIPYASLVRLSAPIVPSHNPARGREAEVSTLYSAASFVSVPASRFNQLQRQTSPSTITTTTPLHAAPGHSHTQSLASRRDTLGPPGLEAQTPIAPLASPRAAYEDRDVAPDATPFSLAPDFIIEGATGLVRVTMLNDRVHALTVDTAGAVAAWDVVRAACLGVFVPEEVRRACAREACGSSISSGGIGVGSSGNGGGANGRGKDNDDQGKLERISPRQALEVVRERIEGEAVVLPWATADTKIGELTIHFFDRCFEAEVFADEVGYGSEKPGDDHRRKCSSTYSFSYCSNF